MIVHTVFLVNILMPYTDNCTLLFLRDVKFASRRILIWGFTHTPMCVSTQYFPEPCEKISQASHSGGIRTHDPCISWASFALLFLFVILFTVSFFGKCLFTFVTCWMFINLHFYDFVKQLVILYFCTLIDLYSPPPISGCLLIFLSCAFNLLSSLLLLHKFSPAS